MNNNYSLKFFQQIKRIVYTLLLFYLFVGVANVKAGVTVHTSCYGIGTGSIDVDVTGIFTNDVEYILTDVNTGIIIQQSGFISNKTYTFSNLPQGKYRVDVVEQGTGDSVNYTRDLPQNSQLLAGSIGDPQNICNGDSPLDLYEKTAASGETGNFSYKWFEVGNAVPVSVAQTPYSPGALIATKQYYREVTDNTCGSTANTTPITITVIDPPTSGGTIAPANQTICPNTAPAGFTSSFDASGGTSPTYIWQYSTTSSIAGVGSWTDIPISIGLNAFTYTSNISVKTYFVRKYYNSCGTVYSNVVTVDVYPTPAQGSIANTMNGFCAASSGGTGSATPPQFNSVAPTGGNGPWTYLWERNTTNASGAWPAAPGVNNVERYTPPASINQTYFYRRIENNSCRRDTTNVIEIRKVDLSASSIIATQPTCDYSKNGQLTASPGSNGHTPYTYSWTGGSTNQTISSLGKGTYWVTITDATTPTACWIQRSKILLPLSSAITVTTPVPTTPSCSSPANGTITVTASGGTPQLTFSIQNTVVPGDTSHIASGNTFTNVASGTFRVWAVDANGCTNDPSAPITTTVALKADNTVSAPSSTPTLCINTALTPITHNTTGATGIGAPTGLPAGVTAAWAGNVITISGTPTTAVGSPFNYSIPLTGGCGNVSATGTITVTPANTVGLPSSTPTLCVNTALTPITHNTTGATGIGAPTGLPAGVTAAWAGNVITISGTPTTAVGSPFNYSIPLTGGCGNVSATGTITVTPANTVGLPSSTPTLCVNTALTPITHNTTGATGIGAPTGLPAGVTAAWAGNVITISGTPTTAVGSPFNYSIPLTGGCGNVSATGTITVTPAPSVSILPSPAVTCTNQDLNLTGNPSGGSGAYTNSWSGSGAAYLSNVTTDSPVFNSNTVGSYSLTYAVTDINGCSANETITVDVQQAPIVNAGNDTTICYNGAVQLNGSSNFSSSVSWSTSGDGTFDDPTLLKPIYSPGTIDKANGSVTLTIEAFGTGSCGSVSDNMKVTIPAQLTASIGTRAPFTIGANTNIKIRLKTKNHSYIEDLSVYLVTPDGMDSITLTTAPYSIDPSLTGCGLGGFPVNGDINILYDRNVVAPFNFCSAITPPNGTYGIEGDWTKLHGQNPAKGGWTIKIRDYFPDQPGGLDGEIDSAYISFTDTSVFTKQLTTINYDVQTAGVSISEDYPIFYSVPLELKTTCSNSCDARAIVNVVGGTAPFSYLWNDPSASTKDSVDLCKGSFTVTVTDALGCTTTASIDVTSPPAIVIDSIKYTPNDTVNCYNGTASVTVYVKGGTGQLKYTLNGVTVNNKQAVNGLTDGTYPLHIFDANGCFKDTSVTIYEPKEFYADSLQIHNVTCNGANNGILEARGHNGTKPYTFVLEKGGVPFGLPRTSNDTVIFRNLGVGNDYQIIVTDKFGCSPDTFENIVITQPAVLDIVQINTTGFVCHGTNNGRITFQQVTGGTRPYEYSLDGTNWQLADSIFNNLLPAVPYTPMVRDANGCNISVGAITLTEANQLFIDSLKVTHVTSCFSNPEGVIRVYAKGGNGILNFSLDRFAWQPDSTFKNLTGGSYRVYVRDMTTGCELPKDTVVLRPAQLVIDSIHHTNVNGSAKGTITVYAKGGTAPLEYSLDSGPYQPSNLFTNLDPKTYIVHVRDAKGCTEDSSATINSISATVTHTDINCKGKNTGTITATVSDLDTYTYSIDGGTTTQNNGIFINLPASTYPVRVVNTNTLAQFDTTIIVTEPDTALSKGFILNNDPSCYGSNEGKIVVTGAKGEMPLQYSINGGTNWQSNNQFSSLIAGNYKVMVSDVNGCKDSASIVLNNPLPLRITANITNVRGSNPGSIKITSVQNGTPPFEFALNAGPWNTTDSLFTGLSAGSYTLTIQEDMYNCRRDTVLTVGTDANLNILVTTKDDSIKCSYDNKGEMVIDVTDPKVTTPIRYQITGAFTKDTVDNSGKTNILFKDLPGGTYNISVTDFTGLTAGTIVTLNNPAPMYITLDSIHRPLCNSYNNNKGDIYISASGGTGTHRFLWSNNSMDEDQDSIPAGGYKVTVFDNNNCYTSDSIYLIPYHQLTVDAGIDLAACPGDGINLQGSGSSTDPSDVLIYEWSPGKFLDDSTSLMPLAEPPSGIYTYTLRAHTAEGCSATDEMILHIWPTYNFRVAIVDNNGNYSFDNPAIVRKEKPIQLMAMPDSLKNFTWMIADIDNLLKIMDNPLIQNPIVNITDSTRFFVSAITPEGCPVHTQIYLRIAGNLLIPSGFTPNGDGVNDYWEIGEAEGYPDLEVEVFNRWGSKVYYSRGYNDSKNFNGTLNGKSLPMGTYYYVIRIPGAEIFKGTVTIVR